MSRNDWTVPENISNCTRIYVKFPSWKNITVRYSSLSYMLKNWKTENILIKRQQKKTTTFSMNKLNRILCLIFTFLHIFFFIQFFKTFYTEYNNLRSFISFHSKKSCVIFNIIGSFVLNEMNELLQSETLKYEGAKWHLKGCQNFLRKSWLHRNICTFGLSWFESFLALILKLWNPKILNLQYYVSTEGGSLKNGIFRLSYHKAGFSKGRNQKAEKLIKPTIWARVRQK